MREIELHFSNIAFQIINLNIVFSVFKEKLRAVCMKSLEQSRTIDFTQDNC